jgi:tetratricopeptide (TPR) repeat protein
VTVELVSRPLRSGAVFACLAFAFPGAALGAPTAITPSATAVPGEAHAASESERRAGELFDEAKRHFEAGEDAAAAVALERAVELSPDPRYLFNLGLVYHWGGDCPKARAAFELYLRRDPGGEGRPQALTALQSLHRLCGPSAPATASRTHPNEPGAAPAAVIAAEGGDGASGVLRWSLTGIGAGAAVLAVVSGVLAHEASSEMEKTYRLGASSTQSWDDCACRIEYESLDDRRARLTLSTWVLGVSSVSLLGIAATLWLSDTEVQSGVSVSVDGVRYRGTF